ncbi:SulP family inorganic anion transporter [Mycobacterium sp. 852013-50091_SCH5140682]|uniref:SulP family inorganic anion transporter n=1 Tax=Mycobacterium sp. 852013-50091_SCH5140682 TaxID=1834109 RepID=UPI0012EA02A5|nr:SulP family inorganic anion transporter [Mycobacterium sp. 852013-50091_SCH5140682]
MWRDWMPGLAQWRGFQLSWLRGDFVAGVTVAAYLVPQVMAYATVAGLPAVTGLWASCAAIAAYTVFGSSRLLSVGPESTTALMTAAVIAPMAAGDAMRYAALAAVLAVMVGVVCLAGAAARLGMLANLLSRPVMVGYMTGIAIVMIASQLGKVTGVPVAGEQVVDLIRSFLQSVNHVHWPTALLAAGVLVLLYMLGRFAPRIPGPLIAVLLASAVTSTLSLRAIGIVVVGTIPAGVPALAVPRAAPGDLAALILPAMGIAIVAFSDNVLTARAFASGVAPEVDVNAELRALGLANVGAGLMRGFPVSSSGSRTALSSAVGGRTQAYSVIALIVVVVVMLWGRGLLAQFPVAALGALVIYAAAPLIDFAEYRRLRQFRRSELVLALATAVAVLGLGVFYGVLAAIALSILDLLRRVAHAHDSVLGFVPGVAGMHDIEDYPDAMPVPGLVIYRYDAPLCFANAQDFRRRALAAVEQSCSPVEWFVLNAEANVEVDLTALDAIDQLREELSRRGVVFAMARVKQDLRGALAAAGLLAKIGEDRIYMTLPTAVQAFQQR